MKYTEEFKQKVLSLKNINKDFMEELLNSDFPSDLVGRLLNQYEGVSAKDIIDAYENNDFEEIYEKAKDKLLAEKLFEEWKSEYYPQFQNLFCGIDQADKNTGIAK